MPELVNSWLTDVIDMYYHWLYCYSSSAYALAIQHNSSSL